MKSVKSRINQILEHTPGRKGDHAAVFVQVTLAIVILLNTFFVIIYTMPPVEENYRLPINLIFTCCVLVFAAEYILRLWSCTDAPTLKERAADRLRYATGFFMIIDLISIIPLIFPVLFPQDFAMVKTFRLLSVFKLGRYARYSEPLALLKRVIVKKREIFSIMLSILVFLILFSATLMYLVENSAQPEKFSSIPAAMWWAVITVTTVGYGNIVPVTPLGQILTSIMILGGVLLLALPSAILAAGFIEERQKNQESHESFLSVSEMELLERLAALKESGHIAKDEFEMLRNYILPERSHRGKPEEGAGRSKESESREEP
jgi:voltage-gated potassium channel